jgi:hypothetical protein
MAEVSLAALNWVGLAGLVWIAICVLVALWWINATR